MRNDWATSSPLLPPSPTTSREAASRTGWYLTPPEFVSLFQDLPPLVAAAAALQSSLLLIHGRDPRHTRHRG